ncbi:MAG: DUF3800 domain-containing protein [Thermoanaerobaculia bacterium]
MNIYIDESGSFVSASTVGKWNAVVAVAVPEAARRDLACNLRQLKLRHGTPLAQEIKLNALSESEYFDFLQALGGLNLAVFCTATDAGSNTLAIVREHQQNQVRETLRHIGKMRYEGGRLGVQLVASQIAALSQQLYMQLICQVDLLYDVVSRATLYYAQHCPSTLREFRWRIDQKNTNRTDFEDAFEKLCPALIQSRSMAEPLMLVSGFDYSYMTQYEIDKGATNYLKDDYNIEIGDALNIQKIIRGNIRFMDSRQSAGIQAADLIASGFRRCLRREFASNEAAAEALGALMLQAQRNEPSVNLVTLARERPLDDETSRLILILSSNSKRMIKRPL